MPAQKRGFTLVELLVVISIIAILSVIGIVVFTGVQKGARDARRKGDINAIATALEAHFGDTSSSSCTATSSTYCLPTTSTTTSTLPANWFSNGQVPSDPLSSSAGIGVGLAGTCGLAGGNDYNGHCWYCVKGGGLNPTAGYCSNPDGEMVNFNPEWNPKVSTVWMICANLETGNPRYYCRRSTQ